MLGQFLDFEGEADGEEDFDDDHYYGQDIGGTEEPDQKRHDGDEDGEDEVSLGLIQPREGHKVGTEDHGIDHEHLVRDGGEDPHGYQYVQ